MSFDVEIGNQAAPAQQNQAVSSLQDRFLDTLISQRILVSVYLTNGIKLQGHIVDFDHYVLVLKSQNKQTVFKHAIATIVPSKNIAWHASGSKVDDPADASFDDDDQGQPF